MTEGFSRVRGLVERLEEHATGPSVVLSIDARGGTVSITRDEMLTRGRTVARGLAGLGVEPGDRVACLVPTSPDFLVLLIGIWSASAVIVPIAEPPLRAGRESYRLRLGEILADSAPKVVVGTVETLAAVREVSGGDDGATLTTVPQLEQAAGGDIPDPPAGDDPALLQYTSGSTGGARAAVIRHRNIEANILAIGRRIECTPDDSMLSWLPLYHDMGLIGGLMCPLFWGIPSHLIPTPLFLRNPTIWPRLLTELRTTLCPAATFAYDLLAKHASDRRLGSIDLSAIRYFWVGAEQVFQHSLDGFQARFGAVGLRETALHPAYGLAEATLAVSHAPADCAYRAEWIDRNALRHGGVAEPAAPGSERSVSIVGNGPPLDNAEVRVVGGDGQALAERYEGLIQVRGPAVTSGYYSGESPIRDGWLDTGDLGFLAEGDVFITGRRKDMIIRGGLNFRPTELEHAASGVPGLRTGRVAAVAVLNHEMGREDIVVVAERRGGGQTGDAELAEAIQKSVVERAGVQIDRVVLVDRGTLPITSSGKLKRQACRALIPDTEE